MMAKLDSGGASMPRQLASQGAAAESTRDIFRAQPRDIVRAQPQRH